MNNRDTILPDSVSIFKNIAAFDLSAKAWFDDLRLEMLLVYIVDQVRSEALPILAAQFDVLGFKGWALCNTDDDRRALIKRAIELHRYKGTPWAIKESLKSIGFTNVRIEEHTPDHWAKFRVYLENENVQINDSSFSSVVNMIEEYKNARSYLDSIVMTLVVDDDMEFISDEAYMLEEISADDVVYFSAALFYDGQGQYDGTHDHSSDSDLVIITP